MTTTSSGWFCPFLWLCLLLFGSIAGEDIYFPLLMPNVQPLKSESYLCTAFKMPSYEHQFIVEYLPNVTKQSAHHILIYGCEGPAYYERDTPRAVWECGEMTTGMGTGVQDMEEQIFPRAGTCRDEAQILYSWAMDAPALRLPNGVGFKVGNGTRIKYLVLQVHYANVDRFLDGESDQSGITLRMLPQSNNEINKLAGVLILLTNGRIREKHFEHFEAACPIDEPIRMHPFAFRVHTHKFGQVVSGYLVDQTNNWKLIGKANPQRAQMFYPAEVGITIGQGDWLAVRCTMYNYLDNTVQIGITAHDEMCNFYLMYYVDRMDSILDQRYCASAGPPHYYWDDNLLVPKEVDIEASATHTGNVRT